MIINTSEQICNPDIDVNNRIILTPSTAFGILNKQLVSNIGRERIKGFLIRFGWEMGAADAKQALNSNLSFESLLKQGPIYHCTSGQITGSEYEGCVELDDDNNIISLYGTGTWNNSYEALEYKKQLGTSKTPVCYTLAGYASGFMTTICAQQVLAKEVSCVGKGDSECRWVFRTLKEWDKDIQDELPFYNQTPIVKELEYTYEQLLEQKDYLAKFSNFQKRLTEEIANGSSLQDIADLVYSFIKIPIVIEDIDFHTITYSGLSSDKFNKLEADLHEYLSANPLIVGLGRKEKNQLPFRKKTIKTSLQDRIITPIFVQKEIIGYCSLIYEGLQTGKLVDEYSILERTANAASLILLNEKTRFESFERMKGNFLEQILNGSLVTRKDIITKGRYTGLDLGQPFFLTILNYSNKQKTMEDEFLFLEQILESIYQYFNRTGKNILIGHHAGNIILLMTKDHLKKTNISEIMQELYDYLIKTFPKFDFKLGISNEGNEIENLLQYYEEASISAQFNSKKKIVLFQSLGIVGVLINSKNINGIKMLAKQELGPLLEDKNDPKKTDLIKTLYVFLINGGKLEQTLSDLSISMSGLLYRIKKIESMIDKNLRNPADSYPLLLILESLIALGKLKI
jgi:sugar diacid utilization regulator